MVVQIEFLAKIIEKFLDVVDNEVVVRTVIFAGRLIRVAHRLHAQVEHEEYQGRKTKETQNLATFSILIDTENALIHRALALDTRWREVFLLESLTAIALILLLLTIEHD